MEFFISGNIFKLTALFCFNRESVVQWALGILSMQGVDGGPPFTHLSSSIQGVSLCPSFSYLKLGHHLLIMDLFNTPESSASHRYAGPFLVPHDHQRDLMKVNLGRCWVGGLEEEWGPNPRDLVLRSTGAGITQSIAAPACVSWCTYTCAPSFAPLTGSQVRLPLLL